MFKNRFSLRNLAIIVACLAVVMFSGYEEDDPKDDPIVPKEITGTWLRESSSNDIAITFNCNVAVFAQISSGDWLTFLNNGKVKIGDQKLRNITQTGNLTWTCEELYWLGSNIGWESCTIIMGADGTTIETTGAHGKNTYVKGELK